MAQGQRTPSCETLSYVPNFTDLVGTYTCHTVSYCGSMLRTGIDRLTRKVRRKQRFAQGFVVVELTTLKKEIQIGSIFITRNS